MILNGNLAFDLHMRENSSAIGITDDGEEEG
jgi:hypothetical protein